MIAIVLLTVVWSSTAYAAGDAAARPAEPAPADAKAADAKPREAAQEPAQIDELRRRVEILAAEVEKLRSGETETTTVTVEEQRNLGVAPSAAATYRRKTEGVSFAGYGELLYEKFAEENESDARGGTDRFDMLRAIVYAGYRFNDKFLFNSEIEFEHGGEEVGVEFAYLDYMLNKNFTIRGGHVLLPLGLTNEFHEPNVFIGAKRPETERRILPSTWHENGVGVLGSYRRFNFRAYAVNGMTAEGFTSQGVRGGRQGGAEASAENFAFAGRVDATLTPGIFAGIGLYTGDSSQGAITSEATPIAVGTTITEVHGQAQLRGFDVRALFAQANIDNAGALSRALSLKATQPVAERMRGGYFQVGYNVLSQSSSTVSVLPFIRVENVDTQNRVPDGFSRDLSRDGRFTTFGVEIEPIGNVVIKTDYQWITNEANTGRNQFNVNLGYAF